MNRLHFHIKLNELLSIGAMQAAVECEDVAASLVPTNAIIINGRSVDTNTITNVKISQKATEHILAVRYDFPARVFPLFFSTIPITMPNIGTKIERTMNPGFGFSFGSTFTLPPNF